MTSESIDIVMDQIEKLKQLFPEAITEGKIDWEKLQATLGKENIEFLNERYVLNWAGKSDAFKVLQQSTTATLKPAPEESINFDASENVFIEGENLEVLKVLQKAYYGKVKCIIIDPPYNTGSDSFIYPDSFKESKEEYQKRVGDKDEEGYLLKEGFFRKNSKDSGHYHSNWLSMMYPRLFLAKNLLRDDGVIFVHIDDNEVHNLRLLMNEIFGEENFVAEVIWEKMYTTKNDSNKLSDCHEYILIYEKNNLCSDISLLPRTKEMDDRYKNIDNDSRGPWKPIPLYAKGERRNGRYIIVSPTGKKFEPEPEKHWLYREEDTLKLIEDNRIYFGKDGNSQPNIKRFLSEVQQGLKAKTLWKYDEVGSNDSAKKELKELFKDSIVPFDFPKPYTLSKRILQISTQNNNEDIVIDFFGGSSTTAQAVLELNKEDGGNRKFILVQLPEKCDEQSEAYKAGYKTIADIGKERIRRVIKKIEKEKAEKSDMFDNGELDLGFKVFKLSASGFKIWRGSEITEENLEQQLEMFTNPVKEGSEKENMLYELILKAGYLLTDKIEAKGSYYSVNEGELIIALEEMNEKLIGKIISARPKKVITLDKLFANNDKLKTNTVLQMRDAGVDFKTI